MDDPEYRQQLIHTQPQWQHGLLCRLDFGAGGISLFARPAFEQWITPPDWRATVADIVVDECGQLYWIASDQDVWGLFRHDPRNGLTERVVRLGDSQQIDPRRLWLTSTLLWMFDFRGHCALGFARDTFQILHEITVAPDCVDVAFDRRSAFYTLENRNGRPHVCRYDTPPGEARPSCAALVNCRQPIAIAVGPSGDIYVYCADVHRLLRIRPSDGGQHLVGSRPVDALIASRTAARATSMEIDGRGVIYLAAERPAGPVLHQFDASGSYLGTVKLPRDIRAIVGMGFDAQNNLYLATDRGIGKFSLSLGEIGDSGVYYTRTLDSGVRGGPWHRLALAAELPPRTSVAVEYHASDDEALAHAVDSVFESDVPVCEKCERIERLLGAHLAARPPDVFESSPPPDSSPADQLAMLVGNNRGRYLWLKLTLATFDEHNRPAVRSLRLLYPRTSYLRYLPATYREDVLSASFLERFLALFETVFHDLDRTIDLLFRHFDPGLAPSEFLPWLASWIGVTAEENVPRERIRRLIERSPSLYRRKGTPGAIAEFLEIYTGRHAFVMEQGTGLEPMVLGAQVRLGQRSVVLGSALRGFRVGDSSVIGRAVLREQVRGDDEPFLSLAGRFTVLVDMPREEFLARRRTLERIVDDQKPAHTICTIGLVSDHSGAGQAVLGAGAAVTERQPYQVGVTPLGRGIAGSGAGLGLERGAWVGSEAGLQ